MPATEPFFPSPIPTDVAKRRAELFRETPFEMVERCVLGAAWALKPNRIGSLPALGRMWLSDLVSPHQGLPSANAPPATREGLVGIVHDFSETTLIAAYRRGLFPFTHFGPLKWFSPERRCVLSFDDLHMGKTIRRLMRAGAYRVTFDRDFDGVIKACTGRREGKWHVTWISPRIMRTYAELFDAGYAHSFEVWNEAGELVGGGYGVAINNVFTTESQFSRERDTSKLGFSVLNWHLKRWGFLLNDGKRPTPTILSMGFKEIPRADFLATLESGARMPAKTGIWEVEADLAEIAGGKAEKTSVPKAKDTAPTAKQSA